MTSEEKKNRVTAFLLANQILQKEMQQTLYQIAQFNDAILILVNRGADFIANNIEMIDALFIAATRIEKEDK
jgi:hypothetical protein